MIIPSLVGTILVIWWFTPLAVLVFTIIFARTRQLRPWVFIVAFLVVIVALTSAWYVTATYSVDGTQCDLGGSPLPGMFADTTYDPNSDFDITPEFKTECVALARQIVGWWAAAYIASIVVWVRALSSSPRRCRLNVPPPAKTRDVSL